MHPRLPSGVHLKALETYNLIFNCIGQERLLAELTIYSNGLFPLLSFAAINVRPAILDLYERHLLPLGDRLKPALDGFLIGVLPCLDEGTELMQRIDKLLLQVSTGVGAAYFYSALWRCILQNSSIRLPAITFITLHFNKKRPLSEQAHILGICMQTLVRAICASLLDAHILVQRAILDLLLTCFPLHLNLMNEMQQAMASPHADEETKKSPTATTTTTTKASPSSSSATTASSNSHSGSSPSTLSRRHFKRSELVAIITAALTVLLRRDATLNRRLCDWFFGTDSMSSTSGSVSASASASATSVPTLVNPLLSKSSATAFMSSTSNPPPAGSGSGASTGEIKIRRKKLIYFENHARDLVIEAFKRCIIVSRKKESWFDFNLFLCFLLEWSESSNGNHIDIARHRHHQFLHLIHVAFSQYTVTADGRLCLLLSLEFDHLTAVAFVISAGFGQWHHCPFVHEYGHHHQWQFRILHQ